MAEKIQKAVFSAKLLPETIEKIRKISEITGLKIHAVVKNAVDEYDKNPNLHTSILNPLGRTLTVADGIIKEELYKEVKT